MKILIISIIITFSIALLNSANINAQLNITSPTKPPAVDIKKILQSLIPLIEVE